VTYQGLLSTHPRDCKASKVPIKCSMCDMGEESKISNFIKPYGCMNMEEATFILDTNENIGIWPSYIPSKEILSALSRSVLMEKGGIKQILYYPGDVIGRLTFVFGPGDVRNPPRNSYSREPDTTYDVPSGKEISRIEFGLSHTGITETSTCRLRLFDENKTRLTELRGNKDEDREEVIEIKEGEKIVSA
jgi:hypothetical protein